MNNRVMAVVDDMFFAAKIRGTAEQYGVRVDFARSADAIFETATEEPPSLLIIDLNAQRTDPFALAERLKADERLRSVPILGFFSHVQTELQNRALASGFDRVLPRSAFTKKLPEILQGKLAGENASPD
ncbi:MAG TPA: response regulator [Pyrinomonadaceae bacterium]|jgi:CheY-like chemotaxis protein